MQQQPIQPIQADKQSNPTAKFIIEWSGFVPTLTVKQSNHKFSYNSTLPQNYDIDTSILKENTNDTT